MNTGLPPPPFQRARLVRLLRGLCYGAVGIPLLIAGFYLEETWRGRWASNHFKRAWEARGERFDAAAFVPGPVPDRENLLKAPLLEAWLYHKPRNVQPRPLIQVRGFELGSWQQGKPAHLREWHQVFDFAGGQSADEDFAPTAAEALEHFTAYTEELNDLHAAANERSRARFDFDYSDPYQGDDAPNFVALRTLVQALALHATAELACGRSENAWPDVRVILRLADTLKDQHTLVGGMMRVAIIDLAVKPVWEGLAAQRWKADELAALQKRFGGMNLPRDLADCLRAERAAIDHLLETPQRDDLIELLAPKPRGKPGREDRLLDWTLRHGPRGWIDQNELAVNQKFQEIILALTKGTRVQLRDDQPGEGADRLYGRENPCNIVARVMTPNLLRAMQTVRKNQTAINQAVLACALERFRLAHGELPEKLQALSPEFIDRIPSGDVPLEYRRQSGRHFALVSLEASEDRGGNETTATAARATKPMRDLAVWQYPPKK